MARPVDNEGGALFCRVLPNQPGRVTYAELFFDLVFVFAVTELAHTLLLRFTPLGAVQTALLFLAVWWVWYQLDHQLAQSRADAGSVACFRADGCWSRAVDLDSAGL